MGMEKLFGAAVIGIMANPGKLTQILEEELSLPNIPWLVVDGGVFWTTLAEYKGWKLQQNMVFKNARILDDKGVKIAWGTINGMEKVLDRMARYAEKFGEETK